MLNSVTTSIFCCFPVLLMALRILLFKSTMQRWGGAQNDGPGVSGKRHLAPCLCERTPVLPAINATPWTGLQTSGLLGTEQLGASEKVTCTALSGNSPVSFLWGLLSEATTSFDCKKWAGTPAASTRKATERKEDSTASSPPYEDSRFFAPLPQGLVQEWGIWNMAPFFSVPPSHSSTPLLSPETHYYWKRRRRYNSHKYCLSTLLCGKCWELLGKPAISWRTR